MHRVVINPLKIVFLWSLLLFLAACSTELVPVIGTVDETRHVYLSTIEITAEDSPESLMAKYGGEVVSFIPEAGFAVLGFSKEEGELSTLTTTTNQNTFASPEVTMGGFSAWASGFSAWAGGWSSWAGGFSAWAGGFSAWAGGNTNSSMQANANAWDQINLKEAHALSRNFGEGIKVAVIDSGIDWFHPMFAGRLSPSSDWWDYIDNDWNPQEPSTGNGAGHGTAVASIILQIAPKAKIMPLRVLNADGKGDTDDVVKAIQRAINKGANVINISLGSTQHDQALWSMASYANSRGIMIFASSGNTGGNETMTYPASYSWHNNTYGKTLGIGSVTSNNQLSAFTSYGYHLYGVAPGEGIVAAYPNNKSVKVKGTSFAAPMFAGAAALALSEMPNWVDKSKLTDYFWQSMDFSVIDKNNGIGGARLLDVERLIQVLPNFTEPEYLLKNVGSGKCLDVAGGSLDNGANVHQWDCHNTANQRWKIQVEGDLYKLINVQTGKVLDVSGVSQDNGANVHQWDWLNYANQKWSFINKSEGIIQIKSQNSGKCLDVSGSSKTNGGNILQWSCHDGTNQQWTLQIVN